MTGKKKLKLNWCQGCQEFREQENTGESEMIAGRKHKYYKCTTCGRINKICG